MKTIRRGTFETNSSSCHSITFNNNGKDVRGNTQILYAEARNVYCGSGNYQYDHDDDYEYDAGAPIGNPQGKFEYALICFVEQLNTIAEYKKIAWYDKHPEEKAKYESDGMNVRWNAPLTAEIYNELVEDYESTKNLIIETFQNEYGINVVWEIPAPRSLEEVNSGKTYTGVPYAKELIDVDGCIDHDSSCTQHVEDAWKLADMVRDPHQLYNWTFIDTNDVTLMYCG